MKKLKQSLYWKLTKFRDKDICPSWLVSVIDWVRYEILESIGL